MAALVLPLLTQLASKSSAWTMVPTVTLLSQSLQQAPLYTMGGGWKQRRLRQSPQRKSVFSSLLVSLKDSVGSLTDSLDTTLSSIFPPPPRKPQQFDNDEGSIANNNWVKPSIPSAAIDLVEDFVVADDNAVSWEEDTDAPTVLRYDVGICGALMQTGRLSMKIYQALQSKLGDDNDDTALRQMTLEFTALQVLQVVLQQSGLVVSSEQDTTGTNNTSGGTTPGSALSTISYLAGGVVESMRLAMPNEDDDDEEAALLPMTWPSFDAAVTSSEHTWTPGRDFGLIVRNVPVQRIVLSVPELLASMDPDGTLASQAKHSLAGNAAAAAENDDNSMESIDMDEDPASLADLVAWNRYRVESAPLAVDSARTVYTGRVNVTSYRPIHAQSLLTTTRVTDNATTVRHVMSALVSHGCLLVDVTNGGTDWDQARTLHRMWQSVSALFDHVDTAETFGLPGLHTVADAVGGGAHAKLGFASLQNGALQCLETRKSRANGTVLPAQLSTVLGPDGSQALSEAFDVIVDLCRPVIQVVVAASLVEAGVTATYDEANVYAADLVREALDNGQALSSTNDEIVLDNQGSMSMSPHRLCRYTNTDQNDDDNDETNDEILFGKSPSSSSTATSTSRSEIFGAHTDSTFVTAIPVAAVAGLEVFDEAANCWYRPELAAARHYEATVAAASDTTTTDLPWYARYVILMPGELLQLASRNEVLATVHRVVVLGGDGGGTNIPSSRLSAPVLLRGRPGVTWNAQRYLGGAGTCPLLQECDGQTMQSIDAALMYRSGTSPPP
jgi:hypothetical protein